MMSAKIEKNITVKSLSGTNLHEQRDSTEQSSAGLQTNPTFVSIHQADPSDANIESQYLKENIVADTTDEKQSREAFVASSQQMSVLKGSMSQQIFVWGSNNCGQLGLKNQNFGHFDVPHSLEFQQKIMQVSCGEHHTALVTFSKQLFVMGSNSHG